VNTLWLPVPEFGNYYVSPEGGILSLAKSHGRKGVPRILKPTVNDGYARVKFWKDGKYHTRKVHRIVATVYCPGFAPNLVVNHINGVKTDNCAKNLEWITNRENIKHSHDQGFIKPRMGELNPSSKMTDSQEKEMLLQRKAGATLRELSLIYSVSISAISKRCQK
jgi:hypothetical protein